MILIKILKKDGEILYMDIQDHKQLIQRGFGTFNALQSKEGQLRFFPKRKLYTDTFESTETSFDEHKEMIAVWRQLKSGEFTPVTIEKRTEFVLIFERRADRFLLQDIVEQKHGKRVQVIDTNGQDMAKIKGIFAALKTTGVNHLFISTNDTTGAAIENLFLDEGLNTMSLNSVMGNKQELKTIEHYLINKGYYPEFLERFLFVDEFNGSKHDQNKETLLDKLEQIRRKLLGEEAGPVVDLVNKYFNTIKRRIEEDKSGKVLPLITNTKDLNRALFGNNLTKIKNVRFRLPSLVNKEEFKHDPLVKELLKVTTKELKK